MEALWCSLSFILLAVLMRLTRGSSLLRKAAGFAGARRRAERHTRLCALRPSLYANVKFRSDGTVRPTMRLGGDALGYVRHRCCLVRRRGLSHFADQSVASGACSVSFLHTTLPSLSPSLLPVVVCPSLL